MFQKCNPGLAFGEVVREVGCDCKSGFAVSIQPHP